MFAQIMKNGNGFFIYCFADHISEIDRDHRIANKKNSVGETGFHFSIKLITRSEYLYDYMSRLNWNDTINLFSKLTPRRFWNASKVLASYYLSKWTKKPVQWGYPVSISFEPTTSCNLRCPECPSGLRSFTRPTGMMEGDLFKRTIDELADTLLYLIFYFQGEPYLNPAFLEMVKYASSKKIYTATSTNAHYLNDENAKRTIESGLDRLIICIDGTTQ